MFKFIRDIFKRTEEPVEEVNINLNEVEDWLKKNSPENFEDINNSISEKFDKISETVFIAKKNLSILENATLRNPKIPIKAIHMMQGNRDAYIKRTHLLLDNLNVGNKDYQNAKNFYTNFSKEIENYNKSTARAYFVLQEFFANESRNIAINIKDIDKYSNELNGLITKNSQNAVSNISSTINEINEKLKIISDIENDIKTKKLIEREFEEKLDYYDKKIEKIKSSSAFKRLETKLNEKENLLKEIKQKENELYSLFNNIEKALKKYARESLDEKLIIGYLENPITAIINDNDLKIILVLAKLKEALSADKLELKEDKKTKSIEIIEGINEAYLREFRKGIIQLKDKRMSCEKNIMSDTVMQEYNEVKYKQEHFNSKLINAREEITKLDKLKEKNSIDNLRESIENDTYNITNKKIKITI